MKVNELRIGNYILDDDGIISKINGFKPLDHSVRCDELEGCIILIDIFNHREWSKGWETESVNIKPIELTEEILLKCGFYYDTDYLTFCISSCTLQLDDYGNEGYMCVIFGENLYLIKHLHQLQNLYFALTNEELEINL